MKGYVLLAVAILSLVFAISWTYAARSVRPVTVPPAAPPEPASDTMVAGVGLVEPESENVELSCSVSGLVTGLYVKAGDRVRKGQRLFSLDDRELAADLGVKKAALRAAQARLHKLQQAPRAEEIPPAEAKVTEAKAC